MNIETKYNGQVTINESQIIQFPQGLPSFEEEKQFVLLSLKGEEGPFFALQSVNTPNLAFVVINPFSFFPNYEAKLTDATVEQLEIESGEDVALFVILTVKDPFEETTANLRGPIVINRKNQQAKQIALTESDYHTRHQIIQPQAAATEKEG
ncbi:flagellar assembly protein FliW [Texcoconibacillus texcoconensis]|uniref:Flagellar assembly factor FliW n=1 Tax=Texcoconibacillus texcoconensis TaxID=1095777 RepID=A0A840QQY3_9BACI|nr:flagellar assembly factor FliW [Texcoconibacillus texcoconensis]